MPRKTRQDIRILLPSLGINNPQTPVKNREAPYRASPTFRRASFGGAKWSQSSLSLVVLSAIAVVLAWGKFGPRADPQGDVDAGEDRAQH